MNQIVVKKGVLEKNSIKEGIIEENPLDAIINSEDNFVAINDKRKKYRKQNRPIYINHEPSCDFSNDQLNSGWERLEDNSYYRWDLDMDQQSPEFWDNL